jgi:hypothetical protein
METVITGIYNFVLLHPFLTLVICGCYVAAVGQLTAPTKDSPTWYRMAFAVANFLSLQFQRMSPKVENSPNFEPAVNLQQQMAGQPQTAVKVPPMVEDKKS